VLVEGRGDAAQPRSHRAYANDLTDVVLVGHSFAGSSISGAADRVPERIRQLIYLDALIQENGQSAFSQLPRDLVEARTTAASESSDGLSMPTPPASAFGISDATQAAWVERRLTPHPFATYTSLLRLAHPVGNGLPTSYIICAAPIYQPAEASRQ
jgi:pimeloyl-ACP methyl ester carboxylesterase